MQTIQIELNGQKVQAQVLDARDRLVALLMKSSAPEARPVRLPNGTIRMV